MNSSNITSSTNKVIDTVVLAKASAKSTVASPPAPTVEAAPALPTTEGADPAAETVKAQEKSAQAIAQADEAMHARVQEAVDTVSEFIKSNQRSLEFHMAENSNRVIITVIDRETNKVIRQIPPEDVVNISDQIKRGAPPALDGLLFHGKA